VDPQFPVEALHVGAHRVEAEVQTASNFGIGQALGQELEDPLFLGGKEVAGIRKVRHVRREAFQRMQHFLLRLAFLGGSGQEQEASLSSSVGGKGGALAFTQRGGCPNSSEAHTAWPETRASCQNWLREGSFR
jgi:hypothetical protein